MPPLFNRIKKLTILYINITILGSVFLIGCSSTSSNSSYTSSYSSTPYSSTSSYSSTTTSSSISRNWIADMNTGCLVYNLNPISNETISWSGECKNGYAYGVGTVRWYLNGIPNGLDIGNKVRGKYDDTVTVTWRDKNGNDSEHNYSATGEYLGKVQSTKKTLATNEKNEIPEGCKVSNSR